MRHDTRSRTRRTSPVPLAAWLAPLALTLLGVALAGAQTSGPVARVGKSEIDAREYADMTRQMVAAYRAANGREVPEDQLSVFRREVLEQIIRQRLLRAEAARLGIQVTDSQAEAFLRDDPYFETNGRFDEGKWAELATNAEAYRRALGDARDLLAGRRLLEQIRRQVTPADAELRHLFDTWNGKVLLNTVLVEKPWFEGGVEITPDRLRAYYDSLVAALPSRQEANLELVLVPVLGEASDESAWRRSEQRADSTRRAIERGTPFEDAAAAFGGVRSGGIWRSGESGGLFHADPELGQQALEAAPGTVLARPVRVAGGYAVVRVADRREMAIPALGPVAPRLIEQYRQDWLQARAREDLDSLRAAHPDSFLTGCATWHLALVDTARLEGKKPSRKDLEKWYEENPALFSRLDPAGRGVVTPPYEDVEAQVRATYLDAWRLEHARAVAERIGEAWEKGKRDKKAEAEADVRYALKTTYEAPPAGIPVDVAEAAFGAPLQEAVVATGNRGSIVFVVTERDTLCPYPDELAIVTAQRMVERAWLARKEEAARTLYDAEPGRFVSQPTYVYTFARIEPRPYEITEFEPGAVEKFFEEHKDEFGNPETARGLQILVAVPPGSDTSAARAQADAILARARQGEPFDSLVARYSDEPVTRAQGGDTGPIQRGTAPPALRPLEDLLFTLPPGEIGGPVRTPYGYHIVKVTEHTPANYQELAAVRATIGGRIAEERADRMARATADEAAGRFRTRAAFLDWARERNYVVGTLEWRPGTKALGPAARPEVQAALQAAEPGTMLPKGYELDIYYVAVHLDSIQPPQPASWEEAREQALAEVESELELRAANQAAALTLAELRAGRSWNEATAPWGLGLQNMEYGVGYVVEGVGQIAEMDSLFFGGPETRLTPGEAALLPTPQGGYITQLSARRMPTDAEFLVAREALRQAAADHGLHAYIAELKKRYPVRILRSDLDFELPPPPPPYGLQPPSTPSS